MSKRSPLRRVVRIVECTDPELRTLKLYWSIGAAAVLLFTREWSEVIHRHSTYWSTMVTKKSLIIWFEYI